MSLLLIDAGNSRIKWGLFAGNAWRQQDWTPTAAPRMAAQWSAMTRPENVVVSNVAGIEAAQAIIAACEAWQIAPRFIRAQAAQCGVTNGYAQPEQLGADRWAALIAARHEHPERDLVVVQAGTAVTVDILDASGHFRGGLIMPGIALMQQALAQRTAGLEYRPGRLAANPDNTADAVFSGACNAIAGAIERSARRQDNRALCLLGGGDADILLPLLSTPAEKADNLVLDGVLCIALESRNDGI